jgi:hypothetical protein
MNRDDAQNINPLIVEYLDCYEPNVKELALQAVRLASHQGVLAVVEQMTSHVKRHARQGQARDDNPTPSPEGLQAI